jgi:hypothetical protein
MIETPVLEPQLEAEEAFERVGSVESVLEIRP